MYHVLVQGLELYAYHGVPEAEREVGHRYVIDLRLEVEGLAFETDAVGDTVDYGKVAKFANEVAQGQQVRTVERLARLIGLKLLQEFSILDAVEVTVRKPLPPAPIIAAYAGAMIRSQRDGL